MIQVGFHPIANTQPRLSIPVWDKPKSRNDENTLTNESTNIMTKIKSVVAICKTHIGVEDAGKELQRTGYEMKKLSIMGRD